MCYCESFYEKCRNIVHSLIFSFKNIANAVNKVGNAMKKHLSPRNGLLLNHSWVEGQRHSWQFRMLLLIVLFNSISLAVVAFLRMFPSLHLRIQVIRDRRISPGQCGEWLGAGFKDCKHENWYVHSAPELSSPRSHNILSLQLHKWDRVCSRKSTRVCHRHRWIQFSADGKRFNFP